MQSEQSPIIQTRKKVLLCVTSPKTLAFGERKEAIMPEIKVEDLDNYKAEHLLLLVGGNPLPNAVAASRLVKNHGTVTLLCTKGTDDIGKDYLLPYLKRKLGGHGIHVSVFHKVMDDSRQASICNITQ